MTEPCCFGCGMAISEGWPKGRSVLRCGHPEAGAWCGRATELYPTGTEAACFLVRPAPVWCPERAKKER